MSFKEAKDPRCIGKDGEPKAPKHHNVAVRAQAKAACNTPMAKDESPYQKQANSFLLRHGIKFSAVGIDTKCPLWCDGRHIHGDKYRVSFSRGRKRISFSFWNSLEDARNGRAPTAYDVLASIQKYDPGDIDNFVSEFGYEKYEENDWGDLKPNRKTQQTYKAVVKEWAKTKSFFSDKELAEMQEIT